MSKAVASLPEARPVGVEPGPLFERGQPIVIIAQHDNVIGRVTSH
jgi:hypothetical protein